MNSIVNLFWCWNHCIQLFWLLITTRQAVSAGFWQVYLTQLEKSSYLSFEKCQIILSSIFSAYVMFIVSCISLTKRQSFGNLEPLLNSLCARWLLPDITQSSTNQSACISIITPATILILFTRVKVKNGGYLP